MNPFDHVNLSGRRKLPMVFASEAADFALDDQCCLLKVDPPEYLRELEANVLEPVLISVRERSALQMSQDSFMARGRASPGVQPVE